MISSDILINVDYASLNRELAPMIDAHLLLIDNPAHHPNGDFSLHEGRLSRGQAKLTYSGVGVLRPQIFQDEDRDIFPLRDVLFPLVDSGRVSGEAWPGYWSDVGTLERLRQTEADIRAGRYP